MVIPLIGPFGETTIYNPKNNVDFFPFVRWSKISAQKEPPTKAN